MNNGPANDDQPTQDSTVNKAKSSGKKLLVGIMLVGIIGLIVWLFLGNSVGNDEFNYADEKAPQLTENRSQWSSIEWFEPIDVNIVQAHAVIYWQESGEFSWKCKEQDGLDQGLEGQIEISKSNCLIYLPPQASNINIKQSSVVLVRPSTLTQIELLQSDLRIAENGEEYRYDIDNQNGDIDGLSSVESAETQISIKAVDSSISAY